MLRRTADVKFTQKNGELTAYIGGEIDHHGAREVRYTIDGEVSKSMPAALALDLSGVNFMDSSGLGLILGRYNNATKLGISFSVKNPSASAERIISAAGAGRIIKIERRNSAE